MDTPKFKTTKVFIYELGLSKSTFYRLLRKKQITKSPELLSPKTEAEIRKALGFPVPDISVDQSGTD